MTTIKHEGGGNLLRENMCSSVSKKKNTRTSFVVLNTI